jgi:hypothetical protein
MVTLKAKDIKLDEVQPKLQVLKAIREWVLGEGGLINHG